MGFWQNLVDSYDKNADALKKTYPLSTTSISNSSDMIAIIVIDGDGKFLGLDKFEKKSNATKKSPANLLVNIPIPVTEDSQGRSSNISPHPVFDQYGYLKGEGEKYVAYIAKLKTYAESEFATDPIKAIYEYAKKGSIASNVEEMKLKDKTNIIFKVEIPGNRQTKVWEDETFFDAWHRYYLSEKGKKHDERREAENKLATPRDLSPDDKKKFKEQAKLKDSFSIDYINGGENQLIAISHPKKISNASANSKLVSDNDKTNYTFRGKFSESSEAVSIGYESSQKAHQFLRYLINENDRRYSCGEQVIFSFTIGSMEKLLPPPIEDNSIWGFLQEFQAKTHSDMRIELRAETGFDYADSLRKSFWGSGYGQTMEQHAKTAVVALDAATTGRLAITFYRELDRSEYLEKIAEWHSGCKWHQKFWDKKKEKYVPFVGAPSVDKVIEAIHGKPRSGKDESYTKIKKAARERLLRCIFDGEILPKDYVVAAVRRASNPLGITKGGKFDRNAFEQVVSTACALVRKDYLQRDKEDYKLSIELNRTDRDYLYGRLLGAADKLEEYALYKKKNDRVVTTAIRHMQAFSQRPLRTWQTIHGCLNPYIQTVKGSFAFSELEAITDKFKSGEYEKDTPLNGSYLLGYYHERAYISRLGKVAGNEKKMSDNTATEDNNDK
jgi:CRISPR-associated protein Csd1